MSVVPPVGCPIRRNRSFFFLSAERQRSQANNFVNIDNTQHTKAFGTDHGTAVDILWRAGFPVEVGRLPYRVDSDQVFAKVDTAVDVRVAKRLGLGGRVRLDLMVELFNLFNTTNYNQVNNIFGSGAYPASPLPTFGQFTEAGPPFQAQLAAKISF